MAIILPADHKSDVECGVGRQQNSLSFLNILQAYIYNCLESLGCYHTTASLGVADTLSLLEADCAMAIRNGVVAKGLLMTVNVLKVL